MHTCFMLFPMWMWAKNAMLSLMWLHKHDYINSPLIVVAWRSLGETSASNVLNASCFRHSAVSKHSWWVLRHLTMPWFFSLPGMMNNLLTVRLVACRREFIQIVVPFTVKLDHPSVAYSGLSSANADASRRRGTATGWRLTVERQISAGHRHSLNLSLSDIVLAFCVCERGRFQ